MKTYQLEDPATAKLYELLRTSNAALSCFLEFLGGRALLEEFGGATIEVQNQFRLSKSKFDLLIRCGNKAVIVEAKVNDGQKVYQLARYYDLWEREYGCAPKVFWLTRRTVEDLWGVERCLTRYVTWNQLRDFLHSRLSILNPIEQHSVRNFIDYLTREGITLDAVESPVIVRREKGLDRSRAYKLLTSIGSRFADALWIADEENELPYRLQIGRRIWQSQFEDQFPLKVRIFLEPDANSSAGFFIWPRICLFHWQGYRKTAVDEHTRRQHFSKRFDRWIGACDAAGLLLMKNGAPNARRKGNIPLPKPFCFSPDIKVLLAEEPENVSKQLSNFGHDDDEIIKNAAERIGVYLKIVDRFQS